MAMERPTVAVKVRFMGDLRAVIPEKDLVVTLPQGSTIEDLLAFLSKTYGKPFSDRVFQSEGKLHHYIVVFLNGENIRDVGGFAAKLGDNEVEVYMLPTFEGG